MDFLLFSDYDDTLSVFRKRLPRNRDYVSHRLENAKQILFNVFGATRNPSLNWIRKKVKRNLINENLMRIDLVVFVLFYVC